MLQGQKSPEIPSLVTPAISHKQTRIVGVQKLYSVLRESHKDKAVAIVRPALPGGYRRTQGF